jgi:hypothetical protein
LVKYGQRLRHLVKDASPSITRNPTISTWHHKCLAITISFT